MTHAGREPPAVARRLLERFLGGPMGEVLLGDLLESWAHERDTRGERGARWWFWRETMVALWHFGARPSPSREIRMSSFLGDLRLATRILRRAPVFTGLVTLTLALGIGATAAIYGVVAPVLLRPLPYPHPEQLVMVAERNARGGRDNVGYQTFDDLRAGTHAVAGMAAYGWWSVTLEAPGDPEELVGQRVSWNYFDVLGVRMALGRPFARDEDQPGRNAVVVLSHALWQRRFGGDSSVVGRTIRLDDQPYVVVGVAAADFDNVVFPAAQLWRVLGYATTAPYACRTCRHLNVVARLRDGASLTRATGEMNGLMARLAADHPREYYGKGVIVEPLQRLVTAPMRPALLAILAAAVLVLLIAAANVVSLQLARAVRRDGEFTVRIALGASRGRLAQQLVAEGLLLAVAGGAAGLLIARAALPVLKASLPGDLPRLTAIRLDLPVFGVVAAIVLALALVIGIAPAAVRRTRDVFGGVLRGAARVSATSHQRTRRVLVAGEVALALLLLSGAGLVARSLVRLLQVDMGFEPQHVLTLRIRSTGNAYAQDSAIYAYHARVVAAVRRVPGVVDAGTANQLPLTGDLDTDGVLADDRPLANPAEAPYADRYTVSADLMRTMGIRLLAGRAFTEEDVADSAANVVIVSRALAATLWPGENPIGRRITAGGSPTLRTVVGVAGDVRHAALDARTTWQFYVPEREWNGADDHVALVVRTRGDPAAVAPAVRAAVAAVDPSQPITDVNPMRALVSASTAQRQLALMLFAAFAALALVLAAAGIYGVLAGYVAERTREIGLRTALGATPGAVLSLVLRGGLATTVAGIVLGLLATIPLTHTIHALVFGIPDTDPVTLAGAAATLLLVAAAACVVPARRAIRVDPIVALRSE